MEYWASTKDRKNKKKKKKQTASMSEPVDLEAGEHINQSGTPVVPQEVGVPESSEDESLTEHPILAASKVFTEITEASIPPPPKTKPKTNDISNAEEIVKDESAPKAANSSLPAAPKAEITNNSTNGDTNRNIPSVRETVNPHPLKTNTTSKKAMAEAIKTDELASKLKVLGGSGSIKTVAVSTSNCSLRQGYVLGSKIVDTAYRNAIMDHFITIHVQMRKLTFGSVIDIVYKGTYDGSPMRRLLADMHAFIFVDDIGKLDVLDCKPKAFVKDFLKSVLMIRPNEVDEWWFYLETNTYHK
ncbi:hypothetical protein N0V95_001002 [Ascochyta clinopodiicola]|nr:hypothetical protein N0V95_001002 [Ascochyta clinopodiicola]